jgi:hypothetical protein
MRRGALITDDGEATTSYLRASLALLSPAAISD